MGMCPYLNEISVVREMGHHRSHIGAWICGVRVGKREVPQRMTGIVLSRGTRRGNGWRAEQAGTADSWVHQHSPPPPPVPHLHLCPCQGSQRPAHFLLAQPGWHREGEPDTFGTPLTKIGFCPWKPFHTHPLPLFSQKFFALDLFGDPREVRTSSFLVTGCKS